MAEIISSTSGFPEWEQEMNDPENGFSGTEWRYLQGLPPQEVGHWSAAEYFETRRKDHPYTSIELARSIQQFASLLPEDEQFDELLANQGALDAVSDDVRGQRVVLQLSDGRISGDVGGYTLTPNPALISLRIGEIGRGITTKAGHRKETGRRAAGPVSVGVSAIRGFILIGNNRHL